MFLIKFSLYAFMFSLFQNSDNIFLPFYLEIYHVICRYQNFFSIATGIIVGNRSVILVFYRRSASTIDGICMGRQSIFSGN